MTDFLIYDAKVAVLIAVFYMFYRLMLSRETFHRVNRIVLLLTAVASFVLPLCVITLHKTVNIAGSPTVSVGELQMEVAEETGQALWQIALPLLFIIGVVVTLGFTLVSILKVVQLIRNSEKHPQEDGITLCVTGNADLAPFSFCSYIVMNRSDFEERDAAILAHERGHIRLHHSWDVLLVDLITALQWFNPAIWMLRQDLRAIHEYEADGEVLSQGINARQYQYLLISKATGIGGYSIVNGISHSTLKNRINMMLHKKSQSSHLLKLLALVPIVGITLALNARTVTDYVYDEPQKQQPVKKGKKSATIKMGNKDIQVVEQKDIITVEGEAQQNTATGTFTPSGDKKVFDVVEEMPQYPGGPQELFGFLAKNVKYPAEAEKAGIQGRVIATFVVETDGSITDTHIVKSVDPSLDAEALRVLNAMPNWQPGKQNGEPVRVKYTVPITFRLDGKSKEAPQAEGSFTPAETPQAEGNSQQTSSAKVFVRQSADLMNPSLVIVDGKVSEDIDKVMKSLDPKTIESMTILKDKAAYEQYGEKAKDGVLVITTKK